MHHHKHHRRKQNVTLLIIVVVVVIILIFQLLLAATPVHSHGFLASPRSRNLVAFQDRVYYPITSNDPQPEDCPNCLNRGGILARCGVITIAPLKEEDPLIIVRNYDTPLNALGSPMKSNPQNTYTEGDIIDVEVILTAHHKGHFTFKACPITTPGEVPTQQCFDTHPLLFVSDALYGATPDPNYPERVYVAPSSVAKVVTNEYGFSSSMIFQYQLQLPNGVYGELVLIQWYYVAANSACIHPGYDTYNWPSHWGSNGVGMDGAITADSGEWHSDDEYDDAYAAEDADAEANTEGTTGLQLCSDVLPVDGNGKPEQFWNCAEVTITKKAGDSTQQQQQQQQEEEDTAAAAAAAAAATTTSSTMMNDGLVDNSQQQQQQQQEDTTTTSSMTNWQQDTTTATTTSSTIVNGQQQDPIMTISSTIMNGQQQDTTTTTTSSTVNTGKPKISKTVIGYFASWQWYDRNELAIPMNMDFTKVTRVNFAFFQTDAEGNVWGTDKWADPNLLFGPHNWNPPENDTEYCSWDTPTDRTCSTHFYEEGLIYRVHAAGAEIYPSLGGWSLSDPFPAMAANETARMIFVNNCMELIAEFGFDGIDIDWEYPGYEDHSGTPADTNSYNLLLRDLRSKLDELGESTGKFYGLTAALPCGTDNIANIDIETVAKYLTEFNLMTYDFFGSWYPVTGANAPLYDQEWGDEDVKGFSVDGCVRNWMKGGASPSRINIGLPFYGRSFKKAKGLNETHEGNDMDTWYMDDGSPQYFNIIDKLSEYTSVRHEPTKTQYAYRESESGGLVSYDDEEAICDKTEYVLEHDLNGFIIWELSGDLMADLSTPLLDAMVSKLSDPTLDCRTFANESSENSSTADSYSTGETQQSISSSSEEPWSAPNLPTVDPTTASYSTVETQQSISSSSEELGPPSPAPIPPSVYPTTMQPTIPLICPEDFTGPKQVDRCTGWYHCVLGEVKYPIIRCPEGTLFDETSSLCLESDEVSCTGTYSPTGAPKIRPSDLSITSERPSSKPSPHDLLPSASSFDEMKLTIIPTTNFLDAPSDMSATPTFLKPPPSQSRPPRPSLTPSKQPLAEPSLSSIALFTESPIILSSVTDEPSNTVSEDVYCPDEYTGLLPWNDCMGYYYCMYAVPELPIIKCDAGKLFDVASSECLDASKVDCTHIVEPPSADSPNQATILPTKSPIQHIPNSTYDLSPEFDDRPASTTITESGGDYFQTSSDSPAPTSDISQEDNVPYDWSSTGHASTTEFIPNSGLPEDFSFDGPFITVELLLKDYPNDIGWQLLWLDGTINVEKPVGSYGSLAPGTVVYEFIPIQPSKSRSAGVHELEWTIMNLRGMGLNGGQWKMYSAAPSEETLLSNGGNFGYTDTVWLLLSDEGDISLRDINALNQQPPNYVSPVSEAVDANPNQDTIGVANVGLYSETEEALQPIDIQNSQSKSPDKNRFRLLAPALAVIVAIALIAGTYLLFLAFRKNTNTLGEESDKWNIEEPLDADFFEDYPDSEQHNHHTHCAVDYSDSTGSVYDGYEEESTVTDRKRDELPKFNRNNHGVDFASAVHDNDCDSLSHYSVYTVDEGSSVDAHAPEEVHAKSTMEQYPARHNFD